MTGYNQYLRFTRMNVKNAPTILSLLMQQKYKNRWVGNWEELGEFNRLVGLFSTEISPHNIMKLRV